MFVNQASRILLHILFPSIDQFFPKNNATYAVSSLQFSQFPTQTDHVLVIRTALKTIHIGLVPEKLNSEEQARFTEYLRHATENIKKTLSLLLHKEIKTKINHSPFLFHNNCVQIDLSLGEHSNEKYLKIILSPDFFTLLHVNIHEHTSIETIEQEVLAYFKNPRWTIPDLKSLLITLSEIELHQLFNSLQQKKLLSIYQLYLVIQAYPELSLKIKKALSKNTISDIMEFKRNALNLRITQRDIRGGIYSIEEAIFFLLKKNADFSYASLLHTLQLMLTGITRAELLIMKDFSQWLSEMDQDGLLYQAAVRCSDLDLAQAVAQDQDRYLPVLAGALSERKITDIRGLLTTACTFTQSMQSQVALITSYRSLKINKNSPGPESFEYLLVHCERKRDFQYLLLEVGWFVFATALKNAKQKNIHKVITHVAGPAAFLMSDMLKGIINPDILHDELQVNKARSLCVQAITRLYEDGYILF